MLPAPITPIRMVYVLSFHKFHPNLGVSQSILPQAAAQLLMSRRQAAAPSGTLTVDGFVLILSLKVDDHRLDALCPKIVSQYGP